MCRYPGCERVHSAKGLCRAHYLQLHYAGGDESALHPIADREALAELRAAKQRVAMLEGEVSQLRAALEQRDLNRQVARNQVLAVGSAEAEAGRRAGSVPAAPPATIPSLTPLSPANGGGGASSGSADRIRDLLGIIDLQREGFLRLEAMLGESGRELPEEERRTDERAEAALESAGW